MKESPRHPGNRVPGETGITHATALYTPQQRARREASPWTTVQAILAPLQFGVFLISLALVVGWLITGDGYLAATLSILAKTAVLYAIMVTGAIWEKDVFGQYLFAPAFFWEDVVSMGVIALHSVYLVVLIFGVGGPALQMGIALAAYALYAVNAGQFVLKLVQARRETHGGIAPRNHHTSTAKTAIETASLEAAR